MGAETTLETQEAEAIAERLVAAYGRIAETAMAGVPICNPALGVAASGFRAWGGRAVGVVLTPWFMNLVAVDLAGHTSAPAANGQTVAMFLPAGAVDFLVGELDGIGRIDSCSLFSPVFEFESMEVALETATEAANAFFDPAALVEKPKPAAPVNRRDLLRGRFGAQAEA
jgi:[NiFe] hydrogenase assembly HybE family chaperone